MGSGDVPMNEKLLEPVIELAVSTKCSSGNCDVEKNMSTGELKESEPVGIQVAPAGTDAPAVGKPTEGALYHPTTSRVFCFTWDRALIRLSNHSRHHLFKDAQPAPDLKSFMGCTTRDAKLGGGQRLPLTAGPQHIPNGIQHQPIREWRATSLLWLGQQRLDSFPQGFRHLKVIDLLSMQLPQLLLGFAAFCAMFLGHDVSLGDGFVGANHFSTDTSFCLIPPARISG